MSYVAACQCDVFVSFANVDDRPISGQPPWVTTFAGDLKTYLHKALGVRSDEGLKMFFTGHGSLEAGLDLADELDKNASSTATFIAVTSPAYVEPNSWTMKELETFQSKMGGGGRIFVIELAPLDSEDEYPESIRKLTRMPFWEKLPHRSIAVTMPPASDSYLQTLIDLGEQIRRQLKKMRAEAAQAQPAAPAPAVTPGSAASATASAIVVPPARTSGRTVYLAQTTDDLGEERKQVRRYLEPYGVEVLPAGIYPQGGGDFLAAVNADLERCDAFVQLLGGNPAMRPPDLAQGYDRAQADLAQMRGMPMLQWLRPDVDIAAIADPMHADLLSGPHVVRGTLESFKADIVKAIEEPEPQPVKAPSPDQYVFIDADAADLPLATELLQQLRAKNFSAAIPLLEGEAADVRRDLEDNIVECHALLMVYGAASPVWIRGQLRLYSKLKHRRDQPLKALAIYVGPPEGKPDIGMNLPECQELTPNDVSKFLSGLYQ